jgi:hypothetical protein
MPIATFGISKSHSSIYAATRDRLVVLNIFVATGKTANSNERNCTFLEQRLLRRGGGAVYRQAFRLYSAEGKLATGCYNFR